MKKRHSEGRAYMGLFKKKSGGKKPSPQGGHMDVYVKCGNCGEIIKTHIVMGHELIPTYNEQGPAYILRKELIGSRCPNRIQLSMDFDGAKRIISQDVTGGEFQELKEL
jgi:hypothetical protein